VAANNPHPDAKPLKLRAEDAEDLAVISACLQDALVRVGDLMFDPRAQRFVAALSRFCWECERRDAPAAQRHERVAAGMRFECVRSAKLLGIDRADRDRVLELLAVSAEPGPQGNTLVNLVFAGTAQVQLEVECIEGYLKDLDAPQPARIKPRHPLGSAP
jgi:Protein of unknown function (DUF2948)